MPNYHLESTTTLSIMIEAPCKWGLVCLWWTTAFGKKYRAVSCIMFSNITEWDQEHIPHKHSGLFWTDLHTLMSSFPYINMSCTEFQNWLHRITELNRFEITKAQDFSQRTIYDHSWNLLPGAFHITNFHRAWGNNFCVCFMCPPSSSTRKALQNSQQSLPVYKTHHCSSVTKHCKLFLSH